MKRLVPEIEFPPYKFIPGKEIHPNKPGGYRYQRPEPQVERIDFDSSSSLEPFYYALDLINFGHFWEAHVWLEALWNAHERTGDIASGLKGLIKIAAGELKLQMHQLDLAIDHFKRGLSLIESSNDSLGLDCPALIESVQKRIELTSSNNPRPLIVNLKAC